MDTIISNNEYFCGLLEEEDYNDILSFLGSRANEEGKMPKSPEDLQQDAKRMLSSNALVHFGLFHRNRMIGTTAINMEDNELTDSYVLPSYRGNRLVDILYDARMRYLMEQTSIDRVVTNVSNTNKASFKAAVRNGFMLADINPAGMNEY